MQEHLQLHVQKRGCAPLKVDKKYVSSFYFKAGELIPNLTPSRKPCKKSEKSKEKLKSIWSKLEGKEGGMATNLLLDGPVKNTNRIRFQTKTINLLED